MATADLTCGASRDDLRGSAATLPGPVERDPWIHRGPHLKCPRADYQPGLRDRRLSDRGARAGGDMNGWHAVSGFLIAIPALLAAARPYRAAVFVALAAASLTATGIWALLNTQLAGGVLYFPNNETDALLHFGTSTIFLAGAADYFLIDTRAAKRRPRRPETNQPGG